MSNGQTIAVTGGTGFLGGYIITELRAAGYVVRALTRSKPVFSPAGITWVRGDLEAEGTLAELVSGCSGVVHAAGLIKALNVRDFTVVNERGTRAVMSAIGAEAAAGRTSAAMKIIVVSSLAARVPKLSPYAASKAAAELAAQSLAQRFNLALTIIRPPAIYGPADRETLPLFRSARWRLGPCLGRGNAALIHAQDAARAIVAALGSPATSGQLYEIHDGQDGGYSQADIFRMIGQALDRRVFCFPVPRLIGQLAAEASLALGRLNKSVPMFSPDKLNELTHLDWTVQDRRLTQATGWRPQIEAPAGLAATARWYLERGWI